MVVHVVYARSTPTFVVGFTDLGYGFPATYTIGFVEAISADAGTGRQLEIGSVEAMVAHL
jgi:hypothetical protein